MRLLSPLVGDLLLILPFVGIGMALEAALSRRPQTPSRSTALNLALMISYLAVELGVSALATLVAVQVVAHAPGRHALPQPHPASAQGVLAWAVAMMAVHDFFYYWMHRAQHQFAWLWAEHAIHHSEEDLNVTTAWRHHWLDPVIQSVFITVPTVYLFGLTAEVAVTMSVLYNAAAVWVHADLPLGGNWAVGNPRWHRVHHSRRPEHCDKNFALVLPLFDRAFGTYYPVEPAVPPTGLNSGEKIETFWTASVFPFRAWWKMLRRRSPSDVPSQPETT